MIKNILLTQTINNASVYGVLFNIRGKPWVIAIDDYLFMYNQNGVQYKDTKPENNYPLFAQLDSSKTVLWGPVFEKAWAKVKGNYLNAASGYNVEGIRSLVGVPVFGYYSSTDSNLWNFLY